MLARFFGYRLAVAAATISVLLGGCTGGADGGSGATPTAPQYTLGGTVAGLDGAGLVLAANTGETLNVRGNGSFAFKTTFQSGSPYYVLVLTQPSSPTQTCIAKNSAGTVESGSVTSVTVACQDKTVPTDTIGGAVVGLTGSGLVLQNNGGDNLTVAANGAFAFPTPLPSGTPYNISVLTPPVSPYEDCAVINGQGTTTDSDVASVGVVCTVNSSPTHTVGGMVTGVSGTLILEDNGRDDLTITADGAFKFPLAIPSGSIYDVTTKSATGLQSEACTFANATGTVGDSDIGNVTITCKANNSLTAAVTGLAGTGLTLQNTDNGDTVAVTANGPVAFPTGVAVGDAYNITVTAQPTNPVQTCVVGGGGAGTAPAASAVGITCTTNTYTVGGTVTGLPDPTSGANLNLVLQDNLGDLVTIPAASTSPVPFTFATPIPSGTAYSVTVQAQAGADTSNATPGVVQTSTVCVAAANTGIVTNANVTNVTINCIRPSGFAYVTNRGNNTVSAFLIDSDSGALLPSGPPVSTGTSPVSASVDTTNNRLYVADNGSNDLAVYSIDPNTGYPTLLSGSPLAPGVSAPTSIALYASSAGQGLYVTNPGSSGPGSITAALLGSSGTSVVPIAGSPFGTGAGATGGLFFYGGDYPTFNEYYLEADEVSDTVSAYVVNDTTGALTQASNGPVYNTPIQTGAAPDSVAGIQVFVSSLEANYDHVYVANSGDGRISIYSMDTQTGGLSPLQSGPVTVGAGLSSLATSVSATCGCYLFASSAQGVWAYSTDAGGTLTPVPGAPFAAGTGPGPIAAISPGVFVVNTGDATVSAFTQDAASGSLVPVTGPAVVTGRTPSSIVVVARPNYFPG